MSKGKKAKKLRNRGSGGSNVHHCVNKCRGGSNHSNNLKKTKIMTHNAIHKAFGNETPSEIIKTVISYFSKVLTPAIQRDLLAILSKHQGQEHNKECYHGDRVKGGGSRNTLLSNK